MRSSRCQQLPVFRLHSTKDVNNARDALPHLCLSFIRDLEMFTLLKDVLKYLAILFMVLEEGCTLIRLHDQRKREKNPG
jgi:hypothetical protein